MYISPWDKLSAGTDLSLSLSSMVWHTCIYLCCQIKELGGPDYRKIGPKMLDHEGKEVPGNRGYKYFGAAKDLPGVKELFELVSDELLLSGIVVSISGIVVSISGIVVSVSGIVVSISGIVVCIFGIVVSIFGTGASGSTS